MMVLEREFTIVNQSGLHARASARLVETARRFYAELRLCRDSEEADCKSILEVMGLACIKGSVVRVRADGEDAAEALLAVAALLDSGFGEE